MGFKPASDIDFRRKTLKTDTEDSQEEQDETAKKGEQTAGHMDASSDFIDRFPEWKYC